ncbi:hypothetical protein R1flu_025668 [Riccia fluitans]|uniref:DRBM domain-containing protein n=1 Tax=Riccia fluitans TaxID=41844 RepID=A0ABD1Y1I4_9MARC
MVTVAGGFAVSTNSELSDNLGLCLGNCLRALPLTRETFLRIFARAAVMMGAKRVDKRKSSVMHKSQLQEYAQKAGILPPVYKSIKEGASHEPRFKCTVTLNGVNYESAEGFPNLKAAEHAAAKAALDALQQTTDGSGHSPSPVHESGLCKNLLQEYAQKNSLPLPVYQSTRSGEDHAPVFTSSVEIAGVKYSGGSAKNKKEAEIKAAKTALLAIQSVLSSSTETDALMVTPVKPQVGLETFIDSQLSNGKKRGRGAQAQVKREAAEETAIKTEEGVEVTPIKTPEDGTDTVTTTTKKKKKSKKAEAAGNGDSTHGIANFLATPAAQKILGVL